MTATILAIVVFCPFPFRLRVPAIVEPKDPRGVYVTVPGTLVEIRTRPGEFVQAGEPLAQLENLRLEQEIATLEGRRNEERLRVEQLERLRILDSEAEELLPTALQSYEEVVKQLEQRMEDRRHLTLRAPKSGIVVPPRRRTNHVAADELGEWSDTPLMKENLGCFLDIGCRFCEISASQNCEVVAIIDQSDVPRVRAGQNVHVLLDQAPGIPFKGQVGKVSEMEPASVPRELLASRRVPVEISTAGEQRPLGTFHQASIQLELPQASVSVGALGRAKIYVPAETLGTRILRYLSRTFRLRLWNA
jgi:putative peptide zinc metalloprotease protein